MLKLRLNERVTERCEVTVKAYDMAYAKEHKYISIFNIYAPNFITTTL